LGRPGAARALATLRHSPLPFDKLRASEDNCPNYTVWAELAAPHTD
jgi:hypothetical protein